MRTIVSDLELKRPASLDEALRLLRDDPPLMPIAGCTDVLVAMNFGTLASRRFLDLDSLDSLRSIEVHDDWLRIGALASYSAIIASPDMRDRLPSLIDAARQIGGVQIQNRGTLGGNIANGSPAGDSLPVLAVADAIVVLQSATETRRVPFTKFYTGYRASVIRPDELIVAIEIPPVLGKQWFRKVGTRAAQAISKIVMAGIRPQTLGLAPRLAIGSVAPTVIRLPQTEAALARGSSIDQAVAVLAEEIEPIDDVRSTALYRRTVAQNLLRRFWIDTA
jgi:CO/xanthine dehydrogenase FAD-binding subunit